MSDEATQSFELTHSDSIAKLAEALAKAQLKFKPVLKQNENVAYMRGGKASKYADLATVIDATQPSLAEEGLTILQWPDVDVVNKSTRLISILLHSSGEWIQGRITLPAVSRDAFTPQTCGSAITYARRYSYSAIIGVAPEEDDDGNAASLVGSKQAAEEVAKEKLSRKSKGEPIEAVESGAPSSDSDESVGTAHITINPDGVTIHPVLDRCFDEKEELKPVKTMTQRLWREKMDAFNVTYDGVTKLWLTDARTLEVLAPQIEGLGYKLKITDKSQAPHKENSGAGVPSKDEQHTNKPAPAGFTTHRIMERKRVKTKTGKLCWHLNMTGVTKDVTLWDTEIGPWLELQPPGAEIVCELSPSKDPEKYGPSIKHIFRINDTEFDDDNKPVLQRG